LPRTGWEFKPSKHERRKGLSKSDGIGRRWGNRVKGSGGGRGRAGTFLERFVPLGSELVVSPAVVSVEFVVLFALSESLMVPGRVFGELIRPLRGVNLVWG
jgi:hypothetical protein